MTKMRGFTLVELLVTVTIIAILGTLSLGPIRAAQSRSRDNQRKAHLALIAQSLDLYYAANRSYPSYTDCGVSVTTELTSLDDESATLAKTGMASVDWIPGLATYITASNRSDHAVPRDVMQKKNNEYYYSYRCALDSESGKSYRLTAILENKNDADAIDQDGHYVVER